MKPILLVDLDGVINVFPVGVQDMEAWTAGIEFTFKFQGITFRVPRGVRERFRHLEQVFDCVWTTGWGEDAGSFIHEHLGFGGDWPVIRFMIGAHGQTWKLRQVQRWCGENAAERPVAWLDDELGWDAQQWADGRGHTLLVRAELEEGLTAAQTGELLAWAQREGPFVERASDD